MTFADTADAVAASTDMVDSKMGKSLKKFLTKNIIKKELKDKVRHACGHFRALHLCKEPATPGSVRFSRQKFLHEF